MDENELRSWRGFGLLPTSVRARLELIDYLEQHRAIPLDVARGARERIGWDLTALLATGLASDWAGSTLEHLSDMRAGNFRPGDPVEFRDPETNEMQRAAFQRAENGVAHLRSNGGRLEVPSLLVQADSECLAEAERLAHLCICVRA